MDIQQSITNQTLVSTTLATHLLSKKSPNTNLVFSPVSIHVILGLIAAGSKDKTLDLLLSFLKTKTVDDVNALSSQVVSLVFADGSASGGPKLSFVNGVWVEKTLSLKHSFKQVVENVYNAVSNQVDFQTKAEEVSDEVNMWAKEHTNGLIKEILPAGSVTNLTRLIFANAIYFKGTWNEKFNPSKTKDYDFHLLDGNKVKVPFMTSNKKQFACSYDGFKVLGLPYLHGEDERRFTMYFYLPNQKDGLISLIQKISLESDFLDRHIPHRQVKVGQFLIPKFKISFGFKANDLLKELGVVLPFTREAELTEMVESSDGGNLYVSSVYHKSFVEVNEEGTEAAAVSAVVMVARCMRIEDEVDFVADHPFLFVIREDTSRVVLFMGQMNDPSVD